MASKSPQHRSLAAAQHKAFWLDRPDAPAANPTLTQALTTDLLIIGAGFTGLWTALLAAEANPGRRIVMLEARTAAIGASGRNGGFCDASITHGLDNGYAHWPNEMVDLVRLGDENLAGLRDAVTRHSIDCHLEATGEMAVAVAPWQVDSLAEEAETWAKLGVNVDLFDQNQVRQQVNSPTYLGGLWRRHDTVMVDPAKLAWGLRTAVQNLGVALYENSPVKQLTKSSNGITAATPRGQVTAGRAVMATNAFPNPVRNARRSIIPVYDHVLMTEPLSAVQKTAIGWEGRQGMADVGNQFHYYRLTSDNRILWGGYDALYHFNNGMGPRAEHNPATSNILAEHFFTTFPQLEGLNFTHQWGGPIGTTSRFTCAWGTSHRGRVSWAAGYTGVGVGASRFGAQVALDLADGRTTERTELEMVRKRPFPFPPEPAKWIGVQATRAALKRSDKRQGRRGLWLKTLDKFGIGFDS